MNVHELGRIHLAGAHVDMPTRFSAAADLPRVALPGALNFIGWGAVDTLTADYLSRPHYQNTNQFTHVKLTAEDMSGQATRWTAALNQSTAPCHVILPMGGFSHEDREGGAIEDPELRAITADILERAAQAYTVERLPLHINSPDVARAAVATLHDVKTQRTPHD